MGDFSDAMNAGGWQGGPADRRGDNGQGSQAAGPREDSDAFSCEAEMARERQEAELKRARLVRTIESEIVPRLVLTRRVRCDNAQSPGPKGPDLSDVKELVRLLLAHDVSVSSAFVETLRQRGATLEAICLDLLAPAARRLGVLWEEDECDFMQVTVGLCRLHQLLRELSPEFGPEESDAQGTRRILLAPCPGDQHTFGIALVAQFLRRADWEVWHEFPPTEREILETVRRHWFAVIGLSVGSETRIDQLTAMIASIRRESRNREIGILVGGPLLIEQPDLTDALGADGSATDGPQAVQCAEDITRARRTAH